jgi:hypothetical protein
MISESRNCYFEEKAPNKALEFHNYLKDNFPDYLTTKTSGIDFGIEGNNELDFEPVPTMEYHKFAVMLYLHGDNSQLTCLKNLFMTGSPVIVFGTDMLEEFWQQLMKPNVHMHTIWLTRLLGRS